jgi:hypothetical protein
VDLESVRQLLSDTDFSIAGVAATLRGPWQNPVDTRVVWAGRLVEDSDYGEDYQRVGARRRMAIQKADGVLNIPRASRVTAPDHPGGEVKTWQVDGTLEATRTHFVVTVIPETGYASG